MKDVLAGTISIAIVDDHPLVRDGLTHVIGCSGGFTLVGLGQTATDAIELVERFKPDLLVLDLNIPGSGLRALRDIVQLDSETRILVLTVSETQSDVLEALRLGASGYALKGISGAELCQVLRLLHQGQTYISPELGARILAGLSRGVAVPPPSRSSLLSKRELQIHLLVRQGCCNKEIGRTLSLSEKTVKHYLTNIFRKLEVRNRTELALFQ